MNRKEQDETTQERLSAGRWDRRLIVRAASPGEHEWFDGQLRDQHYLGGGQAVGDYPAPDR